MQSASQGTSKRTGTQPCFQDGIFRPSADLLANLAKIFHSLAYIDS